jgi:hypothetical protein
VLELRLDTVKTADLAGLESIPWRALQLTLQQIKSKAFKMTLQCTLFAALLLSMLFFQHIITMVN